MKESTRPLVSASGKDLHLYTWTPDQTMSEPGQAAILAHGLGEHCGRYTHVAQHFVDRGFRVYGADHVGFGRSGGRRGDVPGGVATHELDLMSVAELAREELGEKARCVLLGHSMGGLVALGVLLDHPEIAREAVLSGPALNPARSARPAKLNAARWLQHVVPFLTTDHGIRPELVCSDEDVVSTYVSDPLVHRRISTRLIVTLLDEANRVRDSADRFSEDLSLLLLQGEEDRIARATDTRAFAERVACRNAEMRVFPGMRHEVFNERERHEAFDAVDRFLESAAA